MIRVTVLLVLAIGPAIGQLNYEGNPLTEDTEYTADETHLSEKAVWEENSSIDLSTSDLSHPQRLYPIMESTEDKHLQPSAELNDFLFDKLQVSTLQPSARQLQQFQISYDQNPSVNPAELALNTFLNSKTPEESRTSLDYYLQSQQLPESQSRPVDRVAIQDKKSGERVNDQRQLVHQFSEQPVYSQVSQQVQRMPQMDQGQAASQLLPQVNQRQQLPQLTAEGYSYAEQPMTHTVVQPVIRTPVGVLRQETLQPMALVPDVQTRNDVIAPATWWQRTRRIRGKPFPFAQSRIAPGLYKAPIAVPFKHKPAPVEVIYTKPPAILHRGPPILTNPPVPYDASAWLPDAAYTPPSKDVYYSQLYAQSYDPHYYNYIAATGKIRPHLYGKLGKRQEEQDDGIWMELYRGFKKHGLKNLMTPTFLLGMTLPVVTLMLSALVQKRSINRSDGKSLDQEDALREYLERLQSAMECYNEKNSWDTKMYKC